MILLRHKGHKLLTPIWHLIWISTFDFFMTRLIRSGWNMMLQIFHGQIVVYNMNKIICNGAWVTRSTWGFSFIISHSIVKVHLFSLCRDQLLLFPSNFLNRITSTERVDTLSHCCRISRIIKCLLIYRGLLSLKMIWLLSWRCYMFGLQLFIWSYIML